MSDSSKPTDLHYDLSGKDWFDYLEWKENGFEMSGTLTFATDEVVNPCSFCEAGDFPTAVKTAYLHIDYVGKDFVELSNLIETIHESGLSQSFFPQQSCDILQKIEIDLRGYFFYALEAARYLDNFKSLEDKYQAQGDIPALAAEMRNLIQGVWEVLVDQLEELKFSDFACVSRIFTLLAAA
jgi:hypothetical protein